MATPEEMAASMIANLEAKTGKTLDQWLKITSACGLAKHGQITKFLKTDHGVTHGFASLIAHETLRKGQAPDTAEDLVEKQYSGPKAGLRPIYDALIASAQACGSDVEISPKKAYVSLRRNKQFALIQPSTKTRVDLGLNMKGAEPAGRLESSGSFNAMCSHRVRLSSPDDVDATVAQWIRAAYDAS